ncbi:MAG: peroxidase-related enzyme [Gemmatimonadaceae bacterium]
MAFIQTVPVSDSTDDVRAMYAQSQKALGYVPNYAKLFSHRPAVMDAWGSLLRSIRSTLDTRRYELATMAAAHALRSSYCLLAHGTILSRDFYGPDQTTQIAHDFTRADLSPTDVAIMSFAERIARDATSVGAADIQQLRDYGLTDAEIFDVAAAAAVRCFFSKLLDALGAEPDSAFLSLDDHLRSELTVGRSISQMPVEVVSDESPSTG